MPNPSGDSGPKGGGQVLAEALFLVFAFYALRYLLAHLLGSEVGQVVFAEFSQTVVYLVLILLLPGLVDSFSPTRQEALSLLAEGIQNLSSVVRFLGFLSGEYLALGRLDVWCVGSIEPGTIFTPFLSQGAISTVFGQSVSTTLKSFNLGAGIGSMMTFTTCGALYHVGLKLRELLGLVYLSLLERRVVSFLVSLDLPLDLLLGLAVLSSALRETRGIAGLLISFVLAKSLLLPFAVLFHSAFFPVPEVAEFSAVANLDISCNPAEYSPEAPFTDAGLEQNFLARTGEPSELLLQLSRLYIGQLLTFPVITLSLFFGGILGISRTLASESDLSHLMRWV